MSNQALQPYVEVVKVRLLQKWEVDVLRQYYGNIEVFLVVFVVYYNYTYCIFFLQTLADYIVFNCLKKRHNSLLIKLILFCSFVDKCYHTIKYALGLLASATGHVVSAAMFFVQFMDWWYTSDKRITPVEAKLVEAPKTMVSINKDFPGVS